MSANENLEQNQNAETNSAWSKFMRKHWAAFVLFVVAAVLALVGGVYVFVWFVGNAQATALVPASLGLWSMNSLVFFILHAIFWELILVGVPVAVGAVIAWQWWKRLPAEDKGEKMFGRNSRSRNAGGVVSPLLFIAFAIKVYVDGNWTAAISGYSLDYVVGSMVTILIWIAAIFAVPAVAGLIWWIHHETNKKS